MDGEKLRRILSSTGKSEPQIAELLGLTVAQLERNLSAADVPTGFIEKLSAALELSAGFFFGCEKVWRCDRIIADRGPIELPFTPMEIDLPLNDGEKVRYMAAVIIDDCLEADFYPMEKLRQFQWHPDKQTVFFVFRSENDCLIRHFGKDRAICGHELIGESGYRITVEALPSFMVCLYQNRRKVADVPVTGLDSFCDALYILWERYRESLQIQEYTTP